LNLERATVLRDDMDGTTTTGRGLRVAELAAAVGVGADTIRV
jgi:hypothetical protein